MVDDQNIFAEWLEAMQIVPDHRGDPVAARLLGKSVRTVRWYRCGETPPTDVRLLMGALADGYRPRPWGESRVQ